MAAVREETFELGVDRGEVRADGAGTDEESFGDLGIGQPLGNEAQDLEFARCEAEGCVRRAGPSSSASSAAT